MVDGTPHLAQGNPGSIGGSDPGGDGHRRRRFSALVDPLITPDPEGGQVVITRFECESVLGLLRLLLLHKRIKGDVRRQASGFICVRTHISWRSHTMLSISVWKDLESIYSMGQVARHIQAAKRT